MMGWRGARDRREENITHLSRTRQMTPTPHSFAIWHTAIPTAELPPFWITHCFFAPFSLVRLFGWAGLSGTKSESIRKAVGGLIESVAAWVGVSGWEERGMRAASWRFVWDCQVPAQQRV